jgi:hypothetical protein
MKLKKRFCWEASTTTQKENILKFPYSYYTLDRYLLHHPFEESHIIIKIEDRMGDR